MAQDKPLVRIAPNNPVFDLPVIVGIEEKLFDKAGLDVRFIGKLRGPRKGQYRISGHGAHEGADVRLRLGRQL